MPRNDLVNKNSVLARPPKIVKTKDGYMIDPKDWNLIVRELSNIDILSGIGKVIPTTGSGYGLGFNADNSNKAAFFVGDVDNETFLQFNGDNVSLGRKSALEGALYYGNSTPFIHDIFTSLDGYLTATVGGGTATITSADKGSAVVAVGTANNDEGSIKKFIKFPIDTPSGGVIGDWSLIGRFKTRLNINSLSSNTNRTIRVYTGSLNATSGPNEYGAIGFKLESNNTLKGFTYYDDSETTTTLTTSVSSGTSYHLEAVVQAGNGSCKFYVNGTEEGESETNIPAKTADNDGQMFGFTAENTGVSSASANLQISQWMVN